MEFRRVLFRSTLPRRPSSTMTLFPSAARYLVRAVQWSVFPRRLSACIREKIIVSEGCHEVDRQRRAFYIHCTVRPLLGRAGIGPSRAGWRAFGPTCKPSATARQSVVEGKRVAG